MKRKDEGVYECDECGEEFFINTLRDSADECEECGGELDFKGWRDELGV